MVYNNFDYFAENCDSGSTVNFSDLILESTQKKTINLIDSNHKNDNDKSKSTDSSIKKDGNEFTGLLTNDYSKLIMSEKELSDYWDCIYGFSKSSKNNVNEKKVIDNDQSFDSNTANNVSSIIIDNNHESTIVNNQLNDYKEVINNENEKSVSITNSNIECTNEIKKVEFDSKTDDIDETNSTPLKTSKFKSEFRKNSKSLVNSIPPAIQKINVPAEYNGSPRKLNLKVVACGMQKNGRLPIPKANYFIDKGNFGDDAGFWSENDLSSAFGIYINIKAT